MHNKIKSIIGGIMIAIWKILKILWGISKVLIWFIGLFMIISFFLFQLVQKEYEKEFEQLRIEAEIESEIRDIQMKKFR